MRKLVFIIPLLVLVLFVSGCVKEAEEEVTPTEELLSEEKFAVCTSIADESEREICFYNKATETKDQAFCEQIVTVEGLAGRNGCYFVLARNTPNETLCEKIKDAQDMEVTQDHCYWSVARQKQDPLLCDKIKDEEKKEDCLMRSGV